MLRSSKIAALAMPWFAAVALLGSPTVFDPEPAWAQASDVKCDKCVDTRDIDRKAVTASRLASNAVRTSKIKDGAVTAAKLAPGAVIADDIFARILLVSPVGDGANATANCTELQDALGFLDTVSPAPSADNPWLIKIEPGVYGCGSTPILMKPFVDVEGSGETVTVIEGEADPANIFSGVVEIASNSELRHLNVIHLGGTGSAWQNAVFAEFVANAKMTHVTAESLDSTGSVGVYMNGGQLIVRSSVASGVLAVRVNQGQVNFLFSQRDGATAGGGVLKCLGAYDSTFGPLSMSCL